MSQEISLKWMMIGITASLTMFLLAFNGYVSILQYNNATVSNEYIAKYQNISSYENAYSNFADNLSIANSFKLILDTFLTAVNLGLGAIQNIATSLLGTKELLGTLMTEFPEISIVIGFLITFVSIWITYRALSEGRGTSPQ